MQRNPNNPILTRKDILEIKPDLVDVTSVFNPGAIKFHDKYLLMLRVQNRARETYFMIAESENGVDFKVEKRFIEWNGLEKVQERIFHIYDPRITRISQIKDDFFIMYAMDLESGCKLGLGKTDDFKNFEFLGIVSEEDNRNGVLFPEKVNGKFLRLDRPNKVQLENGPLTGNAIWLSESDDLINWKPVKELFKGRDHYWDEMIGAGPPPVKTRKGWLCVYHGIAMHYQPIYQAGVFLLDLKDPSKVIARGRFNILEPRELYETVGQVPNVVFPTGMIIENFDRERFAIDDSEVKIYYGAADTVIGLAETTIGELIGNSFN